MDRRLGDFVEMVKALQADEDALAGEFSKIRAHSGSVKVHEGLTSEAGGTTSNIKKNRYKDILPYDQTRVPITLLADQGASDYINASFIKGATENRSYIATQGPLKQTLGDFWTMVWQYRVKVIIMACREIEMGKKKCEPYWAAYTETATFGPFVVSNVAESQPSEEVVVRTLVAKFQGEVRTISQFQYTAWPDHGIPSAADGILGMMEMVHAAQGGDTSPILVHCSAGCGRTGVICTVDYIHDLLHTKRINDSFSIKDIVMEIRRQRPSAVQTKEQYEFVYHTVAQMFQKALDSDRHNYENLSETCAQVYDDVGTVSRPAPDHCPAHPSKPPAKSKPALKPRTSLPPKEQKMNDTYAVVNKLKNRLPPATAPASTVHHYDNADQGSPRPSGTALYTAVKPKPRFGNSPTAPPKPIYATAAPSNQTRANGSFGRSSVLEPVSYDIGGPANSSTSNHTTRDSIAMKMNLESQPSTDDDYEYVSNPLQGTLNYCTANSLGFNCRVKKPKGPRDPPADWSRAER